jgi:hypothetical protein
MSRIIKMHGELRLKIINAGIGIYNLNSEVSPACSWLPLKRDLGDAPGIKCLVQQVHWDLNRASGMLTAIRGTLEI